MWKVRDLCVKKVILASEGFIVYGNIGRKIYKFLIKGRHAFVNSKEGWKELPRRISEDVNYKFLQFHSFRGIPKIS